ncbi:MAG: Flp pilus assembly protein TadG [Rhodobacteraceae bacterium HLUCCA12]|nr:MAG: Flp pilus assembly protein TadG [Rhodobacteraceae bacterium HLUCCA12]
MSALESRRKTGRLPIALARFAAASEGSLAVFSLFLFVGLLLVGGVGIDLMRYEQERVRLQAATDRAVLAATSLRQTQDVETVIRDYLARENLEHLIHSIESDEGVNFREARVTTRGAVPTILMHMVGLDALGFQVISAAEERVPNLEISLVIDLSGSMNSYNRLNNLKDAAEEFIRTVFNASEEGSVSMSLVPYTGQVNAGAAILDHYDVEHRQEFSHCVDFDASHYTTTALPTGATLTGAGHGFPWEAPPYTSYYQSNDPLSAGFYDCPIAPGNAGLEVTPFSGDPDELVTRVNAMQALGATSIDIGMRWGVALVDPSVQPMAAAMAAAGEIDSRLSDRPAEHGSPDTMKIVVLMTDGENFQERRLTDDVRSGPSPVWINTEDDSLDTFSLYDESSDLYWHRRDGDWYEAPWGTDGLETCERVCASRTWWGGCQSYETQCSTYDGDHARRLDWPELFHRTQMYWAARQIFAPARGGSSSQQSNYAHSLTLNWQDSVSTGTKDQRLQQICASARDTGITVFSIAFEADPGGISGLRQCATTPAHFFDVEGVEIADAFRSIASHIRQLRLVE